MSEEQVVAELRSGMTVGIGGWGSRRKPMSLVRAILRSDLARPHRRLLRRPRRRPALRCRQGAAAGLRLRLARLDPARSPLPRRPRGRRDRVGRVRRGDGLLGPLRRRDAGLVPADPGRARLRGDDATIRSCGQSSRPTAARSWWRCRRCTSTRRSSTSTAPTPTATPSTSAPTSTSTISSAWRPSAPTSPASGSSRPPSWSPPGTPRRWDQPLPGARRRRGAGRRPLHLLRPRLRARRGLPARLRRGRRRRRALGRVQRPLPRGRRAPATRPRSARTQPRSGHGR